MTKIALSFQIGECEIRSTSRPRNSSLSAIIARGVREPALSVFVWSLVAMM